MPPLAVFWFFTVHQVCFFMRYHLLKDMLIKGRAWCYEAFVHLHIICGIGYVGLMFWHCGNMLTSVRTPFTPFASSIANSNASGNIYTQQLVSG